jgi:hypothetical protein
MIKHMQTILHIVHFPLVKFLSVKIIYAWSISNQLIQMIILKKAFVEQAKLNQNFSIVLTFLQSYFNRHSLLLEISVTQTIFISIF